MRTLPFILLYAADMHGCGWHRIISPGQSIMKSGSAYCRLSCEMIPVDTLAACPPDIIVFQRQVEDGQLDYLREVREKLPATKIIYEIDDLLCDVDEQNYHSSFMGPPAEVNRRIAEALKHVDGATCPTLPLKQWLSSLTDKPVHIVPNYLPELNDKLPPIRSSAELRVGWFGGISHDGDLAQIVPAIQNIAKSGAKIKFVFMGMRPPGLDESLYEFHEGVEARKFGPYLANLNLDLVLAPLIDTPFNRAKSVLRLAQAGVVGAAVIASPVGEYKTSHVWRFARENEWQQAILDFAAMTPAERSAAKHEHREWAMQFSADDNVSHIAAGWLLPLPKKPSVRLKSQFIVSGGAKAEELAGIDHDLAIENGPDSIVEAYQLAREKGYGLIVGRPKTFANQSTISRLISSLAAKKDAASISTFSNDGAHGVWLLARNQFIQSYPEIGDKVAETLSSMQMSHKVIDVPFPYGPLAILSPRAVARIGGWPKIGNFSECLKEWGAVAGQPHIFALTCWATSMIPEGPNLAVSKGIPDLREAQFATKEMNAFRAEYELTHARLHHVIPRPPGNDPSQQLETWTSFYAGVPEQKSPSKTARIRLGDRAGWGNAINDDSITFIRFDFDESQLPDEAIAAMEDCDGDMIYCDWLALSRDAKSLPQPVFLTPHPDFIYGLGRDVWTATAIFRKDAISSLPIPADRTQLWMLASKLVESGRATHYPRMMGVAVENMDTDGRLAVIREYWPRFDGEKIADFGFIRLRGSLKHTNTVSVVIPTTGDPWLLRPCLATLARNTGYSGKIDVICVLSGNESQIEDGKKKIASITEAKGIRIVEVPGPFNFSKAANAGIKASNGYFVCLINDDIRFVKAGWLDNLLSFADMPKAGFVSPRLVKQDGNVQCAGTYAGEGNALELFKGNKPNHMGFGAFAILPHATGAPVGACLVARREVFDAVNYLDESFDYNYNDVMLGASARRLGLTNYSVVSEDIMHHESATRGKIKQDISYLRLLKDKKLLEKSLPEPDETFPSALSVDVVCRGMFAAGSNMENLKWTESLPPESERLLVIGRDAKIIAQQVRDLKRVFIAIIDGGRLKIVNPLISSLIAGIPVEDENAIKHVLKSMGINRILCAPAENEETVLPEVAEGWVR